jgi:hypothetical protein
MSFTPNDVIRLASITLQDPDHVRWPVSDLIGWINAALIEIPTVKPNATNETVEIELAQGTYQTLADEHLSLVRAIRNLATLDDSPSGRTGGTPITVVERADLDSAIPNWHDPDVVPFASSVKHVVFDEADQNGFYVMPGNDGTGVIEALVTTLPAAASAADLEADIDIKDRYQMAIVDYVLFRAFSVDAPNPGAAGRAQSHYQLFMAALGAKAQAEIAASPNTTPS